jgi:hypothetical protein
MTNIIITDDNPQCPLCLNKMRDRLVKKKSIVEKIFFCVNVNCMISINAIDPAVGKWHGAKEKCPVCGGIMRAFFRTLDKYFKIQCPHCLKKTGRVVQVERQTVPNNPKDHVPFYKGLK